ncbi:glutamine synthetase family protein [Agathobaculum sp.]|uniref:glutamine synthetase family protein n=1 Tax=Agathobaculum sp. TaxID=2048138 RepID=UPI002A82E105|nr:glutamine synthetase family protein [Agathobaculum sp.]MDY3618849.1 glutamine synthetase family protein [Agathobaculum sp.]
MDSTMNEVVQFIEENDVKFIRLAFCDIFGNQKNIAIMPAELPRAFEQGIHFNAAALRGFLNIEVSDLLLFPDPATLSVLPWRPSQGRVVRFYCDIRYPDGSPFEGDGRHILRLASARARKLGYTVTMGTASEFYLFELDENGHPTMIPHDHGEYFDIAPLDKGENVRRQICLTLEEMGIQPESSHHEQGPGQHEIDFRYADAIAAADNFLTFKSVVKSIATASGLFASFLPKPLPDAPGNGLHLSISIHKNGQNLFCPQFSTAQEGQSFVAGVLKHAAASTIFGNPLTNSYARLGEFEAPKYITWSHQNRSPLITLPMTTLGSPSRMKVRAFDGCINPYIVFALIIHAGLDGIEQSMPLTPACDVNLFTAPPETVSLYQTLPVSLCEAVEYAQSSPFITGILPERTRSCFFAAKQAEHDRIKAADDRTAAEHALYFERY